MFRNDKDNLKFIHIRLYLYLCHFFCVLAAYSPEKNTSEI